MMVNRRDRLIRFCGDPGITKEELWITVIGIGSVGSKLLRELCSLGDFNYNIYESLAHKIENANIGTQWYNFDQVGKYKTEVIQNNMTIWGSYLSTTCLDTFTKNSYVTPITFIATDNIESRELAFKAWEQLEDKRLFIDSRTELWHSQIYVIDNDPKKIKLYKDTFFKEEEINHPICTLKMSSCNSSKVAAIMAEYFCHFIAKEELSKTNIDFIDLPFSIVQNLRNDHYNRTL